MFLKCPGRDSRDISVENILCPECGYVIEIFSDEPKISCPRCRHLVYKRRLPSCLDWCRAAKECLGKKKQE